MPYQFDHRLLADEMEIYYLDDQIGAGLPVWLPNGVAVRDSLEAFVKRMENLAGYQRVVSPHLAKAQLFERSGHLRAFAGDMFPAMEDGSASFYLKPMNCPFHHRIFGSSPRSYRQMPVRLAEYGQVYRYEESGALRGLSRVRGLCQNDAHIYVEHADVAREIGEVLDLHERCYAALGLEGYRYRLSKHDPSRMQDFDGPKEHWIEAESILRKMLVAKGLPFFEADGEAAFYGPKIDVQMKMGSGQEESIASVQLDFNSAVKFDLSFIARDGSNVRPWVIHRAPLGSHERFVALLLEFFDGQLPGWLAPVQLLVIPVGEEQMSVAESLARDLVGSGLRVKVDRSGGSLSKRIALAHRQRPFAKLVLGAKERESGRVSVEFRDGKSAMDLVDVAKEMRARVRCP